MAVENPLAIDFVNSKGGVGKTVGAVNTADHLGDRGRTLLVDGDPDGNATDHLGLYESFYKDDDAVHYGDLMYEDSDADPELEDLIIETDHGFDFLPSHVSMGKYQTWIDEDPYAIFCFEHAIIEPLLGERYDYIVFDSTNSTNDLFQDAVMTAAPNLVIPLLSGPGSEGGLDRLLTGPVKSLSKHRDVSVLAVMPNRFDGNNDEQNLIERLEEKYPQYLPPFARAEMLETSPGPGIRKSKPIDRAWRNGVPLSAYDSENVNNERFAQLADLVANGGRADE
ncbi:ParA family protein [Halomontanus rarus]|uniref:ParA family protein n=1 Tax=Halomontanus rarus TaxID=3034020 RepID=UPI00307BDE4C